MTSFDLDAYLTRIGYDGPVAPTLPVLRGLVARHTEAIAFEAIDVLAERPVTLSLEALTDKLVRRRRGGYCFEHNTLFKAVLDRIGFRTTGLVARVRLNGTRDEPRPRTHMAVRVDLGEPEDGHSAWLADVGFGGLTVTGPLALVPDAAQSTPHETFRFETFGSDLILQAKLNQGWSDLYQLGMLPQLPIDYEVANWFTASHPQSIFRTNLMVTRPLPGQRLVLFNRVFSRRGDDGAAEKRTLDGAADYRSVLTEAFGLDVTDDDIAAILAVLEQQGPSIFNPFD